MELGPSDAQRGMKSIKRLISEAKIAHREGINEEISKLLEDWEEEVKQESEVDTKLDDWRVLIPEPRNTRGKITQFKKTLYLY